MFLSVVKSYSNKMKIILAVLVLFIGLLNLAASHHEPCHGVICQPKELCNPETGKCEKIPECMPIVCLMECEFGFEESNGCQLCQCKKDIPAPENE